MPFTNRVRYLGEGRGALLGGPICGLAIVALGACANGQTSNGKTDAAVRLDASAVVDVPTADAPTDGAVADAWIPSDAVSDSGSAPPGTWVLIKAGIFTMGSPESELCRDTVATLETQHSVKLTRDFLIQNTEISQKEFAEAMGYNVADFDCPECAAGGMIWSEAAAYCNQLSTRAQASLCYSCVGTAKKDLEESTLECEVVGDYDGTKKSIYDCPGYRLPTEAEWEYAYRAGSSTPLHPAGQYDGKINKEEECSEFNKTATAIAWYVKTGGDARPVGQKLPNAWGLYDMAGNLREYVHERYQKDLGKAFATDPVGPAPKGSTLDADGLTRGGDYANSVSDLRAASRQGATLRSKWGTRYIGLGARCVRSR